MHKRTQRNSKPYPNKSEKPQRHKGLKKFEKNFLAISGQNIFVKELNSKNGKTRKHWEKVKSEVKNHIGNFEWEFTNAPGDASKITNKALHSGFDVIVSVSGDGTINEVVNVFFENEKIINPEAVLALFCSGTGGDLPKTLNISKNLSKILDIIKNSKTIKIDVGIAYFNNSTNFEYKSRQKFCKYLTRQTFNQLHFYHLFNIQGTCLRAFTHRQTNNEEKNIFCWFEFHNSNHKKLLNAS